MHHFSVWHVVVALFLIAYFFAIAGFFAYLLYGPGVDIELPSYFLESDVVTAPVVSTATSSSAASVATSSEPVVVLPPAPPPAVAVDTLASFPGTLFICENNKTLKAQFREGSVRLALSDGRGVSLPQTASLEGVATYANTNGSFTFQTNERNVFIQENTVTTYANCTVAL